MAVAATGACGGGGEVDFELSTDRLLFTAAHTCAFPPAQEVTATVRARGDGGTLYIVIVSTDPAVESISDVQITSQTMGRAVVTPAQASSLGPGVFTSTITVSACVDDPTCATGQLSGSPRRIDVRYEIGEPGITDDPSAYTVSRWEVAARSTPFVGDVRLTSLGLEPHAVVATAAGEVSVYRSGDAGASWQRLPAPAVVAAAADFAVVGTDTAIYMSGGTSAAGAATGAVWKFDGSTWTQQTATAFPARARHAMAQHGGRLHVLGGRAGGVLLDDVWASDDEGVTWTQVATTHFPARYDVCAASFGGALYALGGTTLFADGRAELWRSNDGAVWSQVALPVNTPLYQATLTPSARCAVLDDRLYYIGIGASYTCLAASVSTANGTDWQFEAAVDPPDYSALPGAAVVGGAIYIASGGNGARSIYRSVR